jgi:hypothetical protein
MSVVERGIVETGRAGALTRPGAGYRITPTDKLAEFRNGWASSTSAACPASCRRLLVRHPGRGRVKSRELRLLRVLRTSC